MKNLILLYPLIGGVGIYIWWMLYSKLPQLASFITYSLFQIEKGTHLGSALEFFFYDTPKVMMLLLLIVFVVGIIRTFFTPERTRNILSGRNEFAGNILAALLGIVTPFCSCSAVYRFCDGWSAFGRHTLFSDRCPHG